MTDREGVAVEPDWDLAAQPAPDYEVDQRINWWVGKTATALLRGGAAPGSRCTPQITFLNTTRGGEFGTPGGSSRVW